MGKYDRVSFISFNPHFLILRKKYKDVGDGMVMVQFYLKTITEIGCSMLEKCA